MTTITLQGFGLIFPNAGGPALDFSTAELTVAFSQNASSIRYTNSFEPGDSAPSSTFTFPAPIFVGIREGATGTVSPGHLDPDASLLRITWGNGNVTDIILIDFSDSPFEFVGYLGGDPLPAWNSLADFNEFEASVTAVGPITDGPFRPGRFIPATEWPGTVSQDDYALGTQGDDNFFFGRGDDNVAGDDGDDRLQGGAGNDSLVGQNGEDRLFGQDGDDFLEGGRDNDNLFGGNGADNLAGGQGNDFIDGGAGDEDVLDYLAEQQFYGTARGVIVNFEAGRGRDTFGGFDRYANVERVYGTSERDTFTGSADIESITYRGYAGEDIITGTVAGFDVLDYRRDVREGGTAGINVNLLQDRVIDGFGDSDHVTNIDRVRGTDSADIMVGDNTGIRFEGEGGNDRLTGGLLRDILEGDAGNDRLNGLAGGDIMRGGTGNDILNGQFGADALNGDNGNDIVRGDQGNDFLRGGAGRDTLFGGLDNDILDGGLGNDRQTGGAGNDSFVFRGNFGDDTIVDFGTGDDILRLDDALWQGTLQPFQVLQRFATITNGNMVLELDGGQSITLLGVSSNSELFGNIEIF